MSRRRPVAPALAGAVLLATGLAACDAVERGAREEEESMAIYIVAVKREHRSEVPEDWIERLRETPGVELNVEGGESPDPDARADAQADTRADVLTDAPADPPADTPAETPSARRRVRVWATASGLVALRARVGAFCHVEPLVEHRGAADADES